MMVGVADGAARFWVRNRCSARSANSLHRLLGVAERVWRFPLFATPNFRQQTGVPQVLIRETIEGFTLGGQEIKAGDYVRIYLQSIAYDERGGGEGPRRGFFSSGAHSCLGRVVALDVWRWSFTRFLATLPFKAQVTAYTPRIEGYSFTCPEEVRVRISS